MRIESKVKARLCMQMEAIILVRIGMTFHMVLDGLNTQIRIFMKATLQMEPRTAKVCTDFPKEQFSKVSGVNSKKSEED